nr:MAG TPA: PilA, PilC, PilN, PilO, PilM, pilus, ring, membrane channel [Bacteriophage sp.]
MTRLYFYMALAAVAALLAAAVFILAKTVSKKNRRIKELEESVKRQNRSIGFLLKHSSELAEISRGKDELIKKIQESKSDEDVADIVSGIIELNNGRLCDASKG